MNKKILVHIFSPITSTTYDMWLPLNISVDSAANMIARAVSTLSSGLYAYNDTPALYDKDLKRFLDNTSIIYDTGIGNASTLFLI